MARTHHGNIKVPPYSPTPKAGRAKDYGALVGNYVTLRLLARSAVAAATTVVDRIPLPMPFRIVQVCFYGLGGTGTNTFRIRTVNPTYGTTLGLIHAGTAITQGTPSIVTPDTMTIGNRSIMRKGYIEFEITNAGGSQAKGSAFALVTGYFTRHASLISKFALAGQTTLSGPAAGYYDIISVINCKAFTTTDDELAQITMPYDARVEEISYSAVGITVGGTPNLAVRLTKGGQVTPFHAMFDIDAGAGALTGGASAARGVAFVGGGGLYSVDLTAANRNLVKGDTVEMEGHIAAGDSIPIAACSAHMLVWVKGHVAATPDLD